MSLKRCRKIPIGLALLLFLLVSATVLADTIEDKDSMRFGKVTSIDTQGVTFLQGCNGNRVTIPWARLEYIKFDDSCDTQQIGISRSPATEACDKRLVYVVAINGASDRVYGTDIALDETAFRLTLVNSGGKIRIPANDVKAKILVVRRDEICVRDLSNSVSLPSDIKVEP